MYAPSVGARPAVGCSSWRDEAAVVVRFKQAVLAEDVHELSSLLQSGCVDADAPVWPAGRSGAHVCAAEGLASSLACLLSVGRARVNMADVRGHTPVMLAAGLAPAGRRLAVLRLLAGHRADLAYRHVVSGETALHLAVCRGDACTTSALLRLGAPVDQPNRAHETPAHLAAQWVGLGQTACLEALVRAGADCNRRDKHGLSPLYYLAAYSRFCVQKDRERMLALMVAAGAKIDATEFWIDASLDAECPVDFGITKATLTHLEHLRTKVTRPPSLLHLSRLAVRHAYAPNADEAFAKLVDQNLLPQQLAEYGKLGVTGW